MNLEQSFPWSQINRTGLNACAVRPPLHSLELVASTGGCPGAAGRLRHVTVRHDRRCRRLPHEIYLRWGGTSPAVLLPKRKVRSNPRHRLHCRCRCRRGNCERHHDKGSDCCWCCRWGVPRPRIPAAGTVPRQVATKGAERGELPAAYSAHMLQYRRLWRPWVVHVPSHGRERVL